MVAMLLRATEGCIAGLTPPTRKVVVDGATIAPYEVLILRTAMPKPHLRPASDYPKAESCPQMASLDGFPEQLHFLKISHLLYRQSNLIDNMPLVVPGLMTSGGDQQGEWMNKLMGKKLSDSTSNETVCVPIRYPSSG